MIAGSIDLATAQRLGVARVSYAPWSQNGRPHRARGPRRGRLRRRRPAGGHPQAELTAPGRRVREGFGPAAVDSGGIAAFIEVLLDTATAGRRRTGGLGGWPPIERAVLDR
jgi:hypothetical protein